MIWELLLSSMLVPIVGAGDVDAGNWPRFRGPAGDGHSRETGIPIRWDEGSIAWRLPLEGVGQSSPVVWGDKIFLTAALNGGHSRVVFAVDRSAGKPLWRQVYQTGDPGPTHEMNQHASSTCATDGKIVVAFFGKGGLRALDGEGRPLWSRTDLGEFLSIWGTAASPIIHGELVIVCCDQDAVLEHEQPTDAPSKAYLLAVHKRTGATAWQVPRKGSRGWSTPVVVPDGQGREELVVNGPGGIVAYDPKTGETRWHCERTELFGEPTVAYDDELLFAVSGRPGPLLAIRRGGAGNVTDSRVAWSAKRRSRDLSSPIVVGGVLFAAAMNGVAVAYDPRGGAELWKERLGGDVTASPVAADGLVYFVDRGGVTIVVRPGPSLDIVAKNRLPVEEGEDFLASPAVSAGQLFLRSDRALYAVRRRP